MSNIRHLEPSVEIAARDLSTRLMLVRNRRRAATTSPTLTLGENGIEGIEKILAAAGQGQPLSYLVYSGVNHLVRDLGAGINMKAPTDGKVSTDADLDSSLAALEQEAQDLLDRLSALRGRRANNQST